MFARRRDLIIEGKGVRLAPPRAADYAAWAELRRTSEAALRPFEPAWAPDELSRRRFFARLRRATSARRAGEAYLLFIRGREDGALLGGCTLFGLQRGVAMSAQLGYWVGSRHAGRGVATEAVRALLPFAFGTLGLHRVAAACLPENLASRRVLEKCGFRPEGHARGYLRIADAWRDHLLFARLAEDPEP